MDLLMHGTMRIFLELLRNLKGDSESSWFVCGKFNKIMFANEKMGGLPRDERRMKAFRGVLEECQLLDVGYYGSWFTWERGNLLDIGVANVEWMNLFPNMSIQHLPHSFSNGEDKIVSSTDRTRSAPCFKERRTGYSYFI
ncbi:hypothetical protein PVK06_017724 [Gossypium arboreum]|uniref:Reverse transcriptase n=1 Tax=Gossypium arboreum TaxID=29729 RepID=A0ABR0Q3F3_GOSAR|nr:hypothetical protein PVK06_017724 [Gossypium arboreum]